MNTLSRQFIRRLRARENPGLGWVDPSESRVGPLATVPGPTVTESSVHAPSGFLGFWGGLWTGSLDHWYSFTLALKIIQVTWEPWAKSTGSPSFTFGCDCGGGGIYYCVHIL